MVRKLARIAFFVGLVAVVALSLLPQDIVPETGLWDKWNHTLAYAALALSGGVGFKGWRSLLAAAIGLAVLEHYPTIRGHLMGRSGSFG